MPITNQENWKMTVEANKDEYGKAVINVARRVMELLDENSEPLHKGYYPDLNTPHGIICIADDEFGYGITEFQAVAVKSIIGFSHSRGKEFVESY